VILIDRRIIIGYKINMNKVFHFLSIFIIVLVIISSGFGLFYKSDGQAFDFVNQYRDTVIIYGDGKYGI